MHLACDDATLSESRRLRLEPPCQVSISLGGTIKPPVRGCFRPKNPFCGARFGARSREDVAEQATDVVCRGVFRLAISAAAGGAGGHPRGPGVGRSACLHGPAPCTPQQG